MTTMLPPPTAYEASPARREFLLRLAKRLTGTAELAADDPRRSDGRPANHTYSLTKEQSRVLPRSTIA